jgi:glycosyltransferase involved in cell wall biosynthesis
LKLLLVNFEYPPLGGGAANATYFIARALVALGHEPTVLTSAIAGLPSESRADGVLVRRIPALRRSADRTTIAEMGSFLLSSLWHAPSVARATGAEAAIVFFTIPCGPAGWLLHRLQGLPYVVSLRGGDVPGHVREIETAHRLLTPLRRAALRRAVAVVANAPGLARLSESRDPVPVSVIPNGVDTAFFHPGTRDRQEEETRILYVGRLHELKNIDRLLEAFALLRKDGRSASLDVVGDGPERARLASMADALGVAADVRWHGWCEKQELAALYRRATCLVNPSRYEGMPNTVLEAMASGLPVVASNVGGNNDLVTDGRNGFLFELADPPDLHRSLAKLLDDLPRARTMGTTGREMAVRNYSWTSVAERYVALLAAAREHASPARRADARVPS